MKTKTTGIFLMISSIFWIIVNIRGGILSITDNWDYYKEHLIDFSIDRFFIIVPISFLILSITLVQNKERQTTNKDELLSPQSDVQIISIGEWLVNFLITIIPLVGLIFIIIWSNDDKNKIRKNWAVASLIWTGIIFVLSIFLYATIFAAIMKRY